MSVKCNGDRQRVFIILGIIFFLITCLVYKTQFDSYTLRIQNELPTVRLVYEEKKRPFRCNDRLLEPIFVQRANFWAMTNIIPANTTFKCHESITLVSQGDFVFLDNLVPAVKRWNGPVSFAVYAPGSDFYLALASIAYLRNCETDLMKKFVTFHVFFDVGHFPELVNNVPLPLSYNDSFDCTKIPPFKLFKAEDTYRKKNNLTYPLNTARNVAIDAVQTHYMFSLDIELYPSPFFIDRFMNMINSNPSLVDKKIIYVPPYFEVLSTIKVPDTKKELVGLFRNKSAFFFHEHVCRPCHMLPYMNEWLNAEESDKIGIFRSFKRHKSYQHLEPMFVSTVREPIYDDRFFWEGAGDKLPQNYILCLMDYDYAILDNAFLVHKPGVKQKSLQYNNYRKFVLASNNLRNYEVKNEIHKYYGRREGCAM